MPEGPISRRTFLGWASVGAAIVLHRIIDRGPSPKTAAPTPTTPVPTPTPTVPSGPALRGFDVVILGGRVIDPDSKFDGIANVGIKEGTITEVTDRPLIGRKKIVAEGLVVAPGFIDNLTYEPNSVGVWFKIADGITANIGMHGFNGDAAAFFRSQPRWPVHFGGAFDDPWWRTNIGLGAYEKPSPSQIRELAKIAEQQIAKGWIGIDLEPEYQPGISYDEELALARVAAKHDMPVYSHIRYSDDEEPGTEAEAIDELIKVGRESGAAIHIDHINSTGGTFDMPRALKRIEAARAHGMDVTACVYPYNFWSTNVGNARFAPGWQDRFNISYEDLEVPGTGERLTKSSFDRYRASGHKIVIAYAIPEKSVRTALKSSNIMLGTDSILVAGEGRHPRGAGSCARILGKYVREEKILSLTDAIAKMTIMPAKKIEAGAPGMKKKGRLQPGMDADITIFDPKTVIDRATVRNPRQYSRGIEWVLVDGQIVKDRDGLNEDVRPGKPILSAAALKA